jgi:hypothetical protein
MIQHLVRIEPFSKWGFGVEDALVCGTAGTGPVGNIQVKRLFPDLVSGQPGSCHVFETHSDAIFDIARVQPLRAV